MNDLTVSAIDRQIILNNPLAGKKIHEYLGVTGTMFEREYRYAAKLLETSIRSITVRRFVDDHDSELWNDGHYVGKIRACSTEGHACHSVDKFYMRTIIMRS